MSVNRGSPLMGLTQKQNVKAQDRKVCLTQHEGDAITNTLVEEVLGRYSSQQNAQKGSEMWNFYSNTEEMALQRLLSCLGNKPS